MSYFNYFRYPQYLFAKAIVQTLIRFELSENPLTDAPSGDGVIGFWLNKKLNCKVKMLDIDERLVNICRANMPEMDAKQGDIFTLEPKKNNEIWLFINSMYCLPKIEGLIDEKRKKYAYIIGIFPDIQQKNYQCFNRRNPNVNQSPLNINDTVQFFTKWGYQLEHEEGLIHIPFFCSRILNNRWVQKYLVYFDGMFKPVFEPAYKLLLFKLHQN
ncbi:MAG: hypothetical protein IPO14_09650 [Saprospiraceae bacterium]|mgnify:CR=1 FL=1|nr:hypothetical protein [Saprospiraceae bacterium]